MPYVLHTDPRSSHQQIALLIRRMGRSPVLDVGAAQGMLGQLLCGDHLTLDAVEPNPSWAAQARPLYRTVYISSVDTAPLSEQHYPVIVCADVLEHTVDPIVALRSLRRAATPDGIFIVSLPNAVHIAARFLVLCGQFPQKDRGLFDRTHLHFYTRRSAISLLESAGLHVTLVRSSPVPLELVWPACAGTRVLRALKAIQQLAILLAPTLFAYQWIIVAARSNCGGEDPFTIHHH